MAAVFPFVQFEFSHHIGPPEGRYLIRPVGEPAAPADQPEADELLAEPSLVPVGAADVLLVNVERAARPRPRRLGNRAQSERGVKGPGELSVTFATVIKATRILDGSDAAASLLGSVQQSSEEQERWIDDALVIVNRAIAAYRACAADPYAIDVSRADPHTVRIGYGPAAALTRGRWDAAIAVPPPRAPRLDRAARLMPTQGMAAVLAGRARTLEAEELILRAVLDLEHRRGRAAAAGLSAAYELLIGELGKEALERSLRERFNKLGGSRELVADLARRAAAQSLAEGDVQRLVELADEAGALVDAWRYQPVAEQ